jgi:ATP-dependent protease HslVU (ClpYQ) peptidase subunit
MTTIACDGKSMAGDGLATCGDAIFGRRFVKVRPLSDGRIVGVSGSAFHIEPFVEWLEKGGEKPKIDTNNFEALVLQTDGTCLCYDAECRAVPEDVPTATGSGRAFAIGAMDAGADASDALAIAARRDTHTGGQITVLHLEHKLEAVA